MKILFTEYAEKQFLEYLDFIRSDNPDAAIKMRDKALTTLKRLKTFPESGRIIPEYPGFPYREVIVKPCRFFYRIIGDSIIIVAMWHSAQIPDEPK